MSSLRDSYDRITGIYPPESSTSGYEQYDDSQYTPASPFVINEGQRLQIPNNATSPSVQNGETLGVYDGDGFRPEKLFDGYIVRISFKAFASVQQGGYEMELDISAAHDGSIVIAGEPTRMLRGSGSGNVRTYSKDFPIYGASTFDANKMKPFMSTVNGNISLHSISFLIFRIHKGV